MGRTTFAATEKINCWLGIVAFLLLAASQHVRCKDAKQDASTSTVFAPHSVQPLQVCIFTADFWGLATSGGTATAYHMLANVLGTHPRMNVTFLGISDEQERCEKLQRHNKEQLRYECLGPDLSGEPLKETFTMERLGQATLEWLKRNKGRCELVHAHEWGGVFADSITATLFGRLGPHGPAWAIEPHGGHYWSFQGLAERPFDLVSLRIDRGEQMTAQLADAVLSPSRYMIAFLRQRGWVLPADTTRALPNIFAGIASGPAIESVEKTIWRICFCSRFEARKGLKLFVQAVAGLAAAGSPNPRFEVAFIGAEGVVDGMQGSDWIKQQTAGWPFPTYIYANVPRKRAMGIVSGAGQLLVFPSLVDNTPYVLAEAAVLGIPFICYDFGGVLEMFDAAALKENMYWEPSSEALALKLRQVLAAGRIRSAGLSAWFRGAEAAWERWHLRLLARRTMPGGPRALVPRMAQNAQKVTVQVEMLEPAPAAMPLWERLCPAGDRAGWLPQHYLVLVPQGYSFVAENPLQELTDILAAWPANKGIGALTFGVAIGAAPPLRSFPRSPTWLLYGAEYSCTQEVPVAVPQSTFCEAFLAEAKGFRVFYAWVLAAYLRQRGLKMHTVPEVLFRHEALTDNRKGCDYQEVPVLTGIRPELASDFYPDTEQTLWNVRLAPWRHSLASYTDDFSRHQGHMGWHYEFVDDTGAVQAMHWRDSEQRFSCEGRLQAQVRNHWLQPCADDAGNCCSGGGARTLAAPRLRFRAYLHAAKVRLALAYEVLPICGDGVEVRIQLQRAPQGEDEAASTTLRPLERLYSRMHVMNPTAKPGEHRETIRLHFELFPLDEVSLVVDPKRDHACDMVYILEYKLYDESGPS